MIVYGSILSPFTRKVLAFAREKGLTPELRAAGLGQGGVEFEQASPFGKIPGFRDQGIDGDDDFVLSDSSAIIAYLDAKYPMPNLIPVDPRGRGLTAWFDEFADTIVIPETGPIFVNRFLLPCIKGRPGDAQAARFAERVTLPRMLDYLERIVPDSRFLVEDRITLADIAVASTMLNPLLAGARIDGDRWPRADAYLQSIFARCSFAPMIEEARILVTMFAAAAGDRAIADITEGYRSIG
ncbi:glutathione S-transferase family protein [Sphingomonas sp.]|uniref:glutathione S-transferase family protein n=1 Tax=Sphingomonas sp. TaxID=28214 RepID=UPI002C129F0F|nr:glutathione S-transferase family protein [Sphingomonas sp.]HWK36689.1 glutathione S-transferase family protein [Sphingomonas sp.]